MRTLTFFFATTLSATAWAGASASVTIAGSCPGVMTIDMMGSPGGTYVVAVGDSLGSTTVPAGRCAGVELGIDNSAGGALTTFGPMPDSDGDGVVSVDPTIPGGACGQYMVMIDTATCAVSSPRRIGGGGGPMVAAEGRNARDAGGVGFYQIDPDAGTVTPVGGSISYTGLTYDDAGNLWGVEANGCDGARFYSVNPDTGDGVLEHSVPTSACWSGLTAANGTLYHWAESGDDLYEFDPVTGTDTLIYGAGSAGHCLAADASGNMFRISSSSIFAVDEIAGSEVSLGSISGLGGTGRGSACTFHNGTLYYLAGDDLTSRLYTIDTVSLVATDTGIVMPTALFDALASSTP